MSVLNTSIRRPYFPKDKYPRVIDYNFKELVKSSSNNNVEDLIKEYKRLKNEFPPEIHNLIYTNSLLAKGIDPYEIGFEEIDKLNHNVDELEYQNDQRFQVEVKEHPHFRNGSFIKGPIYVSPYSVYVDDFNETELNFETQLVYFYMQQGCKREIENFNLFRALYQSRNKQDPYDKNVNKTIPLLTSGQLAKIPPAAPIRYSTFGYETKLTNILELPVGYLDRSDYSQVIARYKNVTQALPEESSIKLKVVKGLQDTYGDSNNE
jgi:hypothetical protein